MAIPSYSKKKLLFYPIQKICFLFDTSIVVGNLSIISFTQKCNYQFGPEKLSVKSNIRGLENFLSVWYP